MSLPNMLMMKLINGDNSTSAVLKVNKFELKLKPEKVCEYKYVKNGRILPFYKNRYRLRLWFDPNQFFAAPGTTPNYDKISYLETWNGAQLKAFSTQGVSLSGTNMFNADNSIWFVHESDPPNIEEPEILTLHTDLKFSFISAEYC